MSTIQLRTNQLSTMLTSAIPTSTILNDWIETADVIELDRDGERISALVLLATDDAIILDACDDSTPFVVRRSDLVDYRVFHPEAA